MGEEVKYLVNGWKNYLYVILTNIAKGYWYFSQFQYPLRKKEKWAEIDKKIIEKYLINIGKDKRYRRKKSGKANYLFFRLEEQCILLRTEGKILETDDEPWRKLQGSEKIIIQVNSIQFEVRNINNKFSVKLSKQTYRDIKTEIKILLEKRQLDYAISVFNRLNGFPNYSFLLKQKQELKKFFISECRKHFGKIRIKDRLIIKKVPMKEGNLFL